MLIENSIARSVIIGAVVACVSVGGLLVGADAASADSIKYESYQRASQGEECAAQAGETPWQASWGADSSWKPSWEQWANGGTGGWTCTRSITWARTPVEGAAPAPSYTVGSIGPGGGLIFLIDNGVHYEMAPANWGAGESGLVYCTGNASLGTGSGIGAGKDNTAMMPLACTSPAATAALAYGGTDNSVGEWFIPSIAELNAMCLYAANPSQPVNVNADCSSGQDAGFASSAFAFSAAGYWSSQSRTSSYSYYVNLGTGAGANTYKMTTLRVRPIRSF